MTLRFALGADVLLRAGPPTSEQYHELIRAPLHRLVSRWRQRTAHEFPSCERAVQLQLIFAMGQQRNASADWLKDQHNKFYSQIDACRRAVHR